MATAVHETRFTAEDFRRRVRTRLATAPADDHAGDHVLNPHIATALAKGEPTPAAVLVGVVRRAPEAAILLTQRHAGLRLHPGQIAFPGGRIDPGDAGPEAAALREAAEEVGLDAAGVETLCCGPRYLTATGYRVVPVLATVEPGFRLSLNRDEVADAFEVPLSFLMDAANHGVRTETVRGSTRTFFEMRWQDRSIWGATAGILRGLYERLYAAP
jgi:8-oxo-dGTP pyrophosphatase MutT (NUDIX family)